MHLDSDKSEHLNPYPYQNGMNIMLSDRKRHHTSFSSGNHRRNAKENHFYFIKKIIFHKKQKL